MTEPIDLPPEFEQLADLISEQPPHVRDLFRYALVLGMIDDEKAHITGSRVEGDREHVTVKPSRARCSRSCDLRFQKKSRRS